MDHSEKKLDNPVWFSLTETHQAFGVDYGTSKFYRPEYCVFGGFVGANNQIEDIENYAELSSEFFIVGREAILPDGFQFLSELICNQMIVRQPIPTQPKDEITELTSVQQLTDLHALVQLAYPAYFRNQTPSLGRYYGIYKDQELVAITGERMQMDAFVEVSGVITHPEHRGRGYAQQLIAQTANGIFKLGKTPYLHVAESNTRAIGVYHKLGFEIRRKLTFWKVGRKV